MVSWKREIENLFFFCYIIVAFNIMVGVAAYSLYSLVAQLVRAPH